MNFGTFFEVDEQNLKEDVGLALSHDLFEIKSLLRLDLDVLNFENQCFKINTILSKYNMFLRVFELKDKNFDICLNKILNKKRLSMKYLHVLLKDLTDLRI